MPTGTAKYVKKDPQKHQRQSVSSRLLRKYDRQLCGIPVTQSFYLAARKLIAFCIEMQYPAQINQGDDKPSCLP